MTEQSRRKFLKATSIGGATLSSVMLMPRMLDRSASADSAPEQVSASGADAVHGGPFVAYVKNARTGEIAVLAGEHEVVHTDPQLAISLARIAAGLPQT